MTHSREAIELGGHSFNVFGEGRPFTYNEAFEMLSGSTYLIGFWQSYRYFEAVVDKLLREIRPKHPVSEANRVWLSRIGESNSVCLHVRRGDYLRGEVDPPNVCSRSYYANAMGHICRLLPHPKLFVFSDDMAWCRSAFADFRGCLRGQQWPGRRG